MFRSLITAVLAAAAITACGQQSQPAPASTREIEACDITLLALRADTSDERPWRLWTHEPIGRNEHWRSSDVLLQPQWYGTQYQSDDDGMFLYPIAEGAVSDDDRKAMQVPTLTEVQTQLAEMARMHGHVVDPDPPTIEELRKARLGTQPE